MSTHMIPFGPILDLETPLIDIRSAVGAAATLAIHAQERAPDENPVINGQVFLTMELEKMVDRLMEKLQAAMDQKVKMPSKEETRI